MISFGTWSTSTRPVSGTPPPMLYHWRIAFWKSASTAYSASKPGFCALILVNTGVKSGAPFWKKSTVASLRFRFFSAFSSPVDPARPKSVSSPRKAMLLALPSLSSQPISASSMLASVGFTLKVHLLPPTPERSAIDVAEALATTSGTPARSTSGMMASTTELHSPSRMATYFFSASIWVTLFTASAGLQRLSWKSISSLRPSTPPLALASATASSEPQRECWPKVATPPVSGIDEPIMMGPSWARATTENASATTAAPAMIRRLFPMPVPLLRLSTVFTRAFDLASRYSYRVEWESTAPSWAVKVALSPSPGKGRPARSPRPRDLADRECLGRACPGRAPEPLLDSSAVVDARLPGRVGDPSTDTRPLVDAADGRGRQDTGRQDLRGRASGLGRRAAVYQGLTPAATGGIHGSQGSGKVLREYRLQPANGLR